MCSLQPIQYIVLTTKLIGKSARSIRDANATTMGSSLDSYSDTSYFRGKDCVFHLGYKITPIMCRLLQCPLCSVLSVVVSVCVT